MTLFRILKKTFRRSVSRTFNCLQIEASSNCFLKCIMCPRTALADQWKSMDMPFETFEKISQYFTHTKWVYLSGWGEPLLNKRILDMVRLAKDNGCLTGFTTNGMLLTEKTCRRLIELELDVLSVSIAGATKKTHEAIRVGSNFSRLKGNMKALSNLKDSLESEKPKILLLFLMTKQNIGELPLAIKLARDIGANELVATNLTYAATPLHDEIRAFSCGRADESFTDKIKEAEHRAKELKIVFRSSSLETKEVLVCEEAPLNNVYVSCDGYVSPCVYLNPPIEYIPRNFCGSSHIIQRTHFGNVNQTDLLEIWKKEDYRSFRKRFKRRSAILEEILDFNTNTLRRIDELMKVNALPEVCKTCYKAYGI